MIEKLSTKLGFLLRRRPIANLSISDGGVEDLEELFRRIALARKTQKDPSMRHVVLHDPIEDENATAKLVRKAAAKAGAEIEKQLGMGRCHRIWSRTKEILREKHGITWHSPSEMNPGVRFD